MFTSYYGNLKNIPKGLKPIAISRGVPKWFKGEVDKRLAPSWKALKSPREEYDRLFFAQLQKLDAEKVYEELGASVLLCYEKPNDWCHRRAVAEWFEKELGVVVPELGFDRDESYDYKDSCKALAGTKRGSTNEVKEEEPEAVRLRRESYKNGRQKTLFDFAQGGEGE